MDEGFSTVEGRRPIIAAAGGDCGRAIQRVDPPAPVRGVKSPPIAAPRRLSACTICLAHQENSVTDEREDAAQPALVQSLLRATPAEQHLLLSWSRGLGVIRHSDKSAREKAVAVVGLTREKRATWPIVKLIARALKQVLWDARSWKLRLGVGAIVVTFIAVGNGGAGIVALGGGIGLPLWVLMGLGGVVAGVLVDAIKKKVVKPKAA